MAVAAPLAIAAIVSSVAAAGMGAYGAISSGNAQAASANYQSQVAANNAKIADQNATYATQAGQAQEQQQRLKTAALVGSIRSGQAANGLDINSGSPLSVQSSQDELGELDALTIRNGAAREAYGYKTQGVGFQAQSTLDQAQARASQTAGMMGAAGSIIGGASSVAGKWQSYQQTGVFGSTSPKLLDPSQNPSYGAAFAAGGLT